jgi:hypothetical protein
MRYLNESTVELAALEYLRQLGYATAFGPNIAPSARLTSKFISTTVCARPRSALMRARAPRWWMTQSSVCGGPNR